MCASEPQLAALGQEVWILDSPVQGLAQGHGCQAQGWLGRLLGWAGMDVVGERQPVALCSKGRMSVQLMAEVLMRTGFQQQHSWPARISCVHQAQET